jgi:hypothetical protein
MFEQDNITCRCVSSLLISEFVTYIAFPTMSMSAEISHSVAQIRFLSIFTFSRGSFAKRLWNLTPPFLQPQSQDFKICLPVDKKAIDSTASNEKRTRRPGFDTWQNHLIRANISIFYFVSKDGQSIKLIIEFYPLQKLRISGFVNIHMCCLFNGAVSSWNEMSKPEHM